MGKLKNNPMAIHTKQFVKATPGELEFIRKNAPRGLWKMIQIRTKKSRSQVDYQLRQTPENQDPLIIDTTRELFHAVTGLVYRDQGLGYEDN